MSHDFVINKLQGHFSDNNMQFDYIVLKWGLKFHFFSRDDEYSCCNIKE